jgi:hypothetical protein
VGVEKKKASAKESCWNCYKLYIPNELTASLKEGKKCYCSDFCQKKYNIQNSFTCMNKLCGKSLLKSNGLNLHGKWFCKDECAESDPETKGIIDMLAKGPPTYDTR